MNVLERFKGFDDKGAHLLPIEPTISAPKRGQSDRSDRVLLDEPSKIDQPRANPPKL